MGSPGQGKDFGSYKGKQIETYIVYLEQDLPHLTLWKHKFYLILADGITAFFPLTPLSHP